MSPLIEIPLNRRDAVTTLLAMLALVIGSEADGVDAAELPDSEPAPLPTSNHDLKGFLVLFSVDGDRPSRELNTPVRLQWIDGQARLFVHAFSDNPGERDADGMRQVGPLIASVPLIGGVAMLDAIADHVDQGRSIGWNHHAQR